MILILRSMESFSLSALLRMVHIAAIVHWIGGVAFVTTVLLPAVAKRVSAEDRVHFFEEVESRFATQARLSTALAGISGFALLWQMNAWSRLLSPHYWWLHGMIAVWLLFTLMLFVFEPLFLHRWFLERARRDPAGTFRLVQRMHWILLGISTVVTLGAAAGAHGWLWFR